VHRGVYALASMDQPFADEAAAVLACGQSAYVSHSSAGFAFGLTEKRPETVQVTVVGRCVRRPGIEAHRVNSLRPDEIIDWEGIPVTTPTRLILDLAATLETSDLEHVLAQAYAKNLTSRPKLLSLSARYPTRPGVPALRALLDGTPARTRPTPSASSSR
jgi:predicted transcriptional regulator of viral defense system